MIHILWFIGEVGVLACLSGKRSRVRVPHKPLMFNNINETEGFVYDYLFFFGKNNMISLERMT